MGTGINAGVRLLTAADLDGALRLSSTAGWNQRLADWRMLLTLAPAGCFTAVADGQIVGTAIGIDYGRFGWIAMMLVNPEHRGHGLGARLLEAAMAAIPSGLPIRLDATPMGRPLYQRYGFQDEVALTRHVSDAVGRAAAIPQPSGVRRLTMADREALEPIDGAAFGANRLAVLEWMLQSAPEYAHAIESEGRIQYCLGRPGRLMDQIGPVVASDDDSAQALIAAALAAATGKAVVVDVFDAHERFAGWLRARGFAAQRPLFRMCRPFDRLRAVLSGVEGRPGTSPPPGSSSSAVEYAILGPEFG